MLVPADVAVHGQPLGGQFAIKGRIDTVCARIAQEIPAAAQKVVGDVRFPIRRRAASWACGVIPVRYTRKRAYSRIVRAKILKVGQLDRQISLRHGHRTATLAMNDGDGGAPVALARHAPIVQPVVCLRFACPVVLETGYDGRLAIRNTHAVEPSRVHQHTVTGKSPGEWTIGVFSFISNHTHDRQFERGGELEIALVVARHRHDRARPVTHQNIVGDPDRNTFAVDRIDRMAAREDTRFLFVRLLALYQIGLRHDLHVRANDRGLRIRRHPFDQRMLGCEYHVGGAEQGVWSSREHPQYAVVTRKCEVHLCTHTPAYPVGLCFASDVRPVNVSDVV